MDPAGVQELFDRSAATYDVAAFPFFTPFGAALVDFARIGPVAPRDGGARPERGAGRRGDRR